MSDPLELSCEHGKSKAAVVCGHLVNNFRTGLGFIENCSDPNDLQGWCFACEYLFEQEGEMTEAFQAFTKMSLVCVECYAEIKSHHEIE